MLYKETVSPEMWDLLQKLMQDQVLKDHFLVGGTALALRLGHRLSVDLDLFSIKDFDIGTILNHLQNTYGIKLEKSRLSNNTLLTYINNIKVDIISHQYPLLNPVETVEGVRMISNEDIGAMKLHAIHQSGERYKDFVDMYFLLEHEPLKFYLEAYQRKYNKDPYWAVIGLNTHNNIITFESIDLIKNKRQDWKHIKKRLELATKNPSHKFAPEKKDLSVKTKKNRGLRR
ncbi:nucleotidyl transferase AbiEii/AbiGii toxin family protein [Chryseobacterium sp. JM1]|uniref:nucleotidyl transferase AbiEii/AbiGii toxin family protein n=1 Tax=Chryseobacterium sp. JM1 TaxID=1233950 RepID=UPI0004E78417|nr:nucleotidyl transferase AbiEii/AbiGii toxin family protein [Chryseobacterium sp. JM1]KFF18840.1 hypothetical protein IW22_16660 [Chryseobacterium sp. JM1]